MLAEGFANDLQQNARACFYTVINQALLHNSLLPP
jgi:hypothetical protein